MSGFNIPDDVALACQDSMGDLVDNLVNKMTASEAEQCAREMQEGGTPMPTQDYDVSPANPEQAEQQARKILYQQNSGNPYFHDRKAQTPATEEDIDKTFGDSSDGAGGGFGFSGNDFGGNASGNGFGGNASGNNGSDGFSGGNNTGGNGFNGGGNNNERKRRQRQAWGNSSPHNNDMHEAKKRAANKTRERKTTFENGKVDVGNKSVNFKAAYKPMNWTLDDFADENPLKNAERLRSLVSKLVFDTVGGWSRIGELYVSDNRIIVNGIMVIPQTTSSIVDRLPLDSAEYIKSGMLAPLFNWGYLRKMTRLATLGIDSVDLFCTCISDDLGYSRTANMKSLFNVCGNLRVLIIGGDVITADDLDTPKVVKTNKEVTKRFRFKNLVDGYHLDVYNATNGVQDFAVKSVKDYANNRGNKFILWWWGGLLARSAGATVAGTVNLGAHLVGGIFKTIKSAVSDTNSK